jgi:nicotinate-nucleotide pyrophosphorylase (carboxylating)
MEANDYLHLIELAVEEDLVNNMDVTTDALFEEESCTAVLYSRQSGILAGRNIFEAVIRRFEREAEVRFCYQDGDMLKKDDCVAEIRAKARHVLKAERIALNFISFLSGIATKTFKIISEAKKAGNVIILDTRKTIPGYRRLSKYAVKIGGGSNHRMGLYDMVLIKDNHIDAAGSISNAVKIIRNKWKNRYKIEVECRTLEEVEEALKSKVDIIMLDNMLQNEMKESVRLTGKKVKTEASGNITIEKIKSVAECGVDYISMGSLTNSFKAFDFSLRIKI